MSRMVSPNLSRARRILLPILLPAATSCTRRCGPLNEIHVTHCQDQPTHRALGANLRREPEPGALLHDGGGLYLRKRAASLQWTLRLTDPATGAQQWHRLFPEDPQGVYPHKTLAEARAEARKLWATRSDGVDPRAERRHRIETQRRAEAEAQLADDRRLTLRALFERWASVDLQPRIQANGRRLGRMDAGASAREHFERRVFPRLGDVAVEKIARADLLTVLDSAKAEGKLRTANLLLGELKQMFRFALMRDIVARNPLDTVSKREVGGAAVERDRALTDTEVRLLLHALPGSRLQPRFVAAVAIILATGARAGELLGAAWVDSKGATATLQPWADKAGVKLGFVDLQRRHWYLPTTKNQRDHLIHLSDFAVVHFRTLAGLREARGQTQNEPTPWLFPSAGDGPVGSKTLGKQLSDRQRNDALPLIGRSKQVTSLALPGGRWTAHDLRRTTATIMAGHGVSGDVIDECLNHMIESRVRRTYIRDRRTSAQTEAFDCLGNHLASLLEQSPLRALNLPQGRTDGRVNTPMISGSRPRVDTSRPSS